MNQELSSVIKSTCAKLKRAVRKAETEAAGFYNTYLLSSATKKIENHKDPDRWSPGKATPMRLFAWPDLGLPFWLALLLNNELAATDFIQRYFLAVSFLFLLNLPQQLSLTGILCLKVTCFISFTVGGSLVCCGCDSLLRSWVTLQSHCMGSVWISPGIFSHAFICLVILSNPNIPTFETLRSFCS